MLMHSQFQQASLKVCLHALMQLTSSLTPGCAGGTTEDMCCLQLFGFVLLCEKSEEAKHG